MDVTVLGGASCVWEDLSALEGLGFRADAVLAVNDAGARYQGRLDHWASLHPEKLGGWIEDRARRGLGLDFTTWARTGHHSLRAARDVRIEPEVWGGSSGLYGVQIALMRLGAARVALCGVPMTPTAHFFDDRPWTDCETYRRHWGAALAYFDGRVKSMSGWTREILGPPDTFWLGRGPTSDG